MSLMGLLVMVMKSLMMESLVMENLVMESVCVCGGGGGGGGSARPYPPLPNPGYRPVVCWELNSLNFIPSFRVQITHHEHWSPFC